MRKRGVIRFVIGRKDGKREQLTGVDGCWRVKEM